MLIGVINIHIQVHINLPMPIRFALVLRHADEISKQESQQSIHSRPSRLEKQQTQTHHHDILVMT